MEFKTLAIDSIIPYWRNPRRITDEAVNAVAESIRRYGYNQPIVVDGANTIVIGHTRYSALRRLGVTHVNVKIATELSGEQIKQLRVLDNKVTEYNSWDFDKLVEEIDASDRQLMSMFFPEIQFDGDPKINLVVEVTDDVSTYDDTDHTARLNCPLCFHSFSVEVTMKALEKGKLVAR